MKKRILVVGASGLLGSKIIRFAKNFEVVGTYYSHPFEIKNTKLIQLDMKDPKKTKNAIEDISPSCVVLTSTMTDVDQCERDPKEAYATNVLGAKNVALACKERGAKLIYVSTDYVFDGKKGNYSEEDLPHPISVYGKTKLEAEEAITICRDWTIARVSVLYGLNTTTGKSNFITWIIQKLKNNQEITLFTDQIVSPTFADNAAEVILKMIEDKICGLYHIAGKSAYDRYTIGLKTADVFGLESNLIHPIVTEDLALPAERPKNSSLSIAKAERDIKVKFLTLDEGLSKLRSQM